jgi:hypothetical protein
MKKKKWVKWAVIIVGVLLLLHIWRNSVFSLAASQAPAAVL